MYITDPVGNLVLGQKKPELMSDSNFASSSISDKTCETKTNDALSCQTKSLFMFTKVGIALAYIIELRTSTLEECSKDVPLTLEPSVPCLSLQKLSE